MNDLKTKYFLKVSVRDSKISGQGLFADQKISRGTLILSFGGILCSQKDRFSNNVLPSTCTGVTENIIICEAFNSTKDKSDYINHSCSPNAGMFDALTLVAIRDIGANEEIMCDYAFWEGDEIWKMKNNCQCNASNCRKIITGKDWKKINSSHKYYEFYSPFIKKRILENEKKN